MAVGKSHSGIADRDRLAAALDAARQNENILRLTAMGAGVHAQGAADGAGNAREKFETCDAEFGGALGDESIRRRRADAQAMALFHDDIGEGLAAETDHDARHAAVAHDEIGA